MLKKMLLAGALVVGSTLTAAAAIVTYDDTALATGPVVTVDGVTLTPTTTGGSVSTIGSGTFTGLYIGGSNTPGSYELAFSEAITSIEIEFDALSDIGQLPVETLFGFATNLGAVTIDYVNQFGTTFDGTTVTSTENDGQGIISYSGAAFTSFSFDHDQGAQSGFVIERLVINTGTDIPAVPLPASGLLLLAAVGGLALRKRR